MEFAYLTQWRKSTGVTRSHFSVIPNTATHRIRHHSWLFDSMMTDRIKIILLPLHWRKLKCTIFDCSKPRGCCTSQHKAERCPFSPQIPNIPFSSHQQRLLCVLLCTMTRGSVLHTHRNRFSLLHVAILENVQSHDITQHFLLATTNNILAPNTLPWSLRS